MTKQQDKGFILLETIIAIGVLGLMFGGAMGLYTRSIVGLRGAGDQLVAAYLAQDAMEVIIARYQYNSEQYLPYYLEGIECSSDCVVDSTEANVLSPVVAPGDVALEIDGNGRYVPALGTGTPSPYSRTVNVASDGDVTIEVSWQDGSQPRSYILKNTLYDYVFP